MAAGQLVNSVCKIFTSCPWPLAKIISSYVVLKRKLVLLFVMGRKGKRVHEQSVGRSAPSHDYETIKIVSTQNQESTVTESTASSGIPAPPGLDPPVRLRPQGHLWDQLYAPVNKSVNTVLSLLPL